MKLAEILTGPDVWTQGTEHHNGRYCLIGALKALIGTNLRVERARMSRIIEIRGWHEGDTLEAWNDSPLRTWDEVARLVDAYDRDSLLNP